MQGDNFSSPSSPLEGLLPRNKTAHQYLIFRRSVLRNGTESSNALSLLKFSR